jgi:hypothetical protein
LVEGGALRVENNLIHQCAVGMAAIGGGRITASHLTLAENAIAIGADRLLLHEGAPAGAPGPAGRSRVELSASVLWPNIEASSTAPGSRLELAACILSPWEPATTFPQGKDLIAARPEFVAARLGDFRLGEGSAGRGAAAGGGDLGFEPRASPAAAGGGK